MRRNKRALRRVCRFVYLRRRLLLCAVVAALALTAGMLAAFAAVELNPFVTGITLKNNGVPVADNDELTLTTSLEIGYELQDIVVDGGEAYFVDPNNAANRTLIDLTQPYLLRLPDYLKGSNTALDLHIKHGIVDVATLTHQDDDTMQLVFNPNLAAAITASGSTGISDFRFFFFTLLDEGDIGQRNEVTIDLNGRTVKVKVAENTPENAAITGKACANPNNNDAPEFDPTTGRFYWKVVIAPEVPVWDDTAGTADYTQGYVFRDTLGTAQEYVDGSFTIQWGSATPVTGGGTLDTATTANTISYTFGNNEFINDTVTIRYQTIPVDGLFYDNSGNMVNPTNVTVNNTAALYEPGPNGAMINDADGTASYAGNAWLVKTSGTVDRLNRTITWTLTVNTNGRGFRKIEVYDQFGGGTDPTGPNYLAFLPGTLTVDGQQTQAATGFDGHGNNLLYTLQSPTEETYVITYQTEFPNISLDDNANKNISNTAWLEFEWETDHGPGPGTEYGIPTVSKPASLGTSIIAKSGAYDPATKRIRWRVTVNANRLNITGATITDTIDLSNQTGVLDTPAPSTSCATSSNTYTVAMTRRGSSGVYDVVLKQGGAGDDNALGTDTVVITYYTMATDPAFFANNATATFHNTATVGDDIEVGGAPSGLGPFSATADPTGTSRVLDKADGSYDYDANEITWTLSVNANRMALTDVVITDVLPSYLTFVGPANYSAGNYPQPTVESGNTLSFDLGNVSTALTITFKTRLDVDATTLPGGFLFGASNTAADASKTLTLENEAKLTSAEYADPPVAEPGEVTIHNMLLKKTGAQATAGGRVAYTIELNQNGADLSRSQPNGVVVTDTLPADLFVDPADVRLYRANVNAATGAFTRGAEVALDFSAKRLLPPNTLQVTLPDHMADQPCILAYEGVITSATSGQVTLQNRAGLGYSGLTGGDSDTIQAAAAGGGSANLIPGRSALTIKKTDAGDPTLPLPGAVYGLYAPVPNSTTNETYLFQIATTALDANGDATATFIGLMPGEVYTLTELTAPLGYALAAPMPVTAGAALTMLELSVTDSKWVDGGPGGEGGGADIPRTGDDGAPLLWAGLLLAGAGLFAARRKRREM